MQLNNDLNNMQIYCDESGFTGNRLLDADQPIFTFASVASNEEETQFIVEKIIKDYGIQNGEIKSGNLVKNQKGLRALDEILEILDGRYKICICDKKYTIAGKFFEYIFEPALAAKNSIFYGMNFHRFITDYLHLKLVTQDKSAEVFFEEFYKVMKDGVDTPTKSLFQIINNQSDLVLDQIQKFAHYNKDSFLYEMDGYLGEGSGKWILDITTTCLFSSLGKWGQKIDILDVYCDSSKPLNANQEIFNSMVGRTEKKSQIHEQMNLEQPLTFNLKRPVQMVDSKNFYGIQLADAIAGSFNYAYKNIKDEKNQLAQKWMNKIFRDESILVTFLGGDYEYANIEKASAMLNWLTLNHIVQKCERGLPVLDNISNEINFLKYQILSNRPSHIKVLDI
ncbi:DUF3800 domain-containing protein [Acinetobacter johnsonii]|uniref:DUF3800 domain-containing protein n=1 Tax=Acinetobacter johnsonii TaxID=40214 RepID=UPI0024477445|nr:DUF3800 domain-containing protein [Acinetobacter johnsonii]MDH1520359.1 DUF3800 domain-containing protein [Acinetobacter johnsonii]